VLLREPHSKAVVRNFRAAPYVTPEAKRQQPVSGRNSSQFQTETAPAVSFQNRLLADFVMGPVMFQ
jgi:hypothetical protein